MPVERWTRERRREQTRTALLDAATEIFAKRGFAGASLDEIADAAGYTRGAIAFNFGTKEDLFLAVVERHNDALTEAYAKVLAGQGRDTPLEDIAAVWQEMEAGDVETLLLMLELRLFALRNPAAREKIAAYERRTEETIGRFVAEQSAAAGVRHSIDPTEFGAILYAAGTGLQQHVAVCPNDHSRLFERFLELLVHSATDEGQPSSKRATTRRTRG